jgi:hypothetical protein
MLDMEIPESSSDAGSAADDSNGGGSTQFKAGLLDGK